MPFLSNTFFLCALWKFQGANQPEIYVNMNNVDTFEFDRSQPAVYLFYKNSGDQAQRPNNNATRTLLGSTAAAFIADIDALFP